jgi:hypothetical protein
MKNLFLQNFSKRHSRQGGDGVGAKGRWSRCFLPATVPVVDGTAGVAIVGAVGAAATAAAARRSILTLLIKLIASLLLSLFFSYHLCFRIHRYQFLFS